MGPATSLHTLAPHASDFDPVGDVNANDVVRGADGKPVHGLRCHRLTWMRESEHAAAGCASNMWSNGSVVTGNCCPSALAVNAVTTRHAVKRRRVDMVAGRFIS